MLINQQITPEIVANPITGLPSISTEDLVQLMRIDKSMGTQRIAGYISDAYDHINGQIPYLRGGYYDDRIACHHTCPWESAPSMISHHHRLAADTDSSLYAILSSLNTRAVPIAPPTTALNSITKIADPLWIRTYKRAVLNEAAALMVDNQADFDTIGQGITRGNNDHTKSNALRRVVSHAVADLRGKRRNRITLL